MTNDEFDDAYGRWEDSHDAGVAEIANFGWGLYSSDLLPYRLKGRHAVSEEVRQTANRARLFLQTHLEYEWPRNVNGVVSYWGLWGPGCYLLVGLILLFVACAEGSWHGVFVGAFGLLAIIPTFHWLVTRPKRAEELRRFDQSGDFRVWPFLRQADSDGAQGRIQLEVEPETSQ
jgi:hypothetical protein